MHITTLKALRSLAANQSVAFITDYFTTVGLLCEYACSVTWSE